ncbi:nucleopolyhedrovirus P10 family protein [Streptomyces monticola]|uniref:Nucleopolyhedrovirus P10 family protein n=1 Tax=Streptomyces monticola TaxID=2666263 RepID=A0ABW2JMM3_9ACTN
MTADGWTRAVRDQLGLGRLLPLGGAADGAWIAESAAAAVLRDAARSVRGVRIGSLRLALADPETAGEPAVPAPPGALPPGALRLDAEFEATAARPLPATADELRGALSGAAATRLGLVLDTVDLRVTALLDTEPQAPAGRPDTDCGTTPPAGTQNTQDAQGTQGTQEDEVAAAAAAVPGVVRLAGALGGAGRAVHIGHRTAPDTLAARHIRVELATATGVRALDVALAVRRAVASACTDRPTVAVVVTAVSAATD